ncbi:MAG: plastocyanin/azurin family copper-binding protein [Pseudomonadota bacterium]
MSKFFVLLLGVLASYSFAADFPVEQKNKAFTASSLKVKVGDTVTFKNVDAFNHNIFSLSDAKSFDLGSYPQGQSRSVTMDKPGTVEVECSIHPDMKMTIEVAK